VSVLSIRRKKFSEEVILKSFVRKEKLILSREKRWWRGFRIFTPASFSTTFYHNAKLAVCHIMKTWNKNNRVLTVGALQTFILFQELSYKIHRISVDPSSYSLSGSCWARLDAEGGAIFVTGRPPEKPPAAIPQE
jgi:hypothetical protein